MRALIRLWTLVSVFTLCIAPYATAEVTKMQCYLVDSRVHVAVLGAESSGAGHISWRDTVTGESGELPFTTEGANLRCPTKNGTETVAHVLPDLAIVVKNPPWRHPGSQFSLGVALN